MHWSCAEVKVAHWLTQAGMSTGAQRVSLSQARSQRCCSAAGLKGSSFAACSSAQARSWPVNTSRRGSVLAEVNLAIIIITSGGRGVRGRRRRQGAAPR